jgi:hypothetical protein
VQITDNLIVDYINRFWLMDVDARVQLFDLKTKYQFQTIPGIDQYNMPLYEVQSSDLQDSIGVFPVYQGFMQSCYCNGIQIPFYTERSAFYNIWPDYLQPLAQAATGDGKTQKFTFSVPFFPAVPGHLDISGVIDYVNNGPNPYQDPIFVDEFSLNNNTICSRTTSFYPGVYITYTDINGNNVVISDSGMFLYSATSSDLYGLLMVPGNAPFGNMPLSSSGAMPVFNYYSMTENTINYNTGIVNVNFPSVPPAGTPIQAQCYFYEQGLPRAVLFYNNCLKLRNPPNTQYLIELDAYLTPAAFLNSANAIPFGYMSEYIARGAARKILSDTGDVEQFNFYEPLFIEQERLVWKRSQRQITATRTGTIFSELGVQSNYNNIGGGAG